MNSYPGKILILFLMYLTFGTTRGQEIPGSILTGYLQGSSTKVSKQWDVAISPKGLAITSSQKEYIPMTIHFQIPEPTAEVRINAWEIICNKRWETEIQTENCETAIQDIKHCPHSIILNEQIKRIKKDYSALYGLLLTSDYYVYLLGGIFRRTPDLCSVGPHIRNATSQGAGGRVRVHSQVPIERDQGRTQKRALFPLTRPNYTRPGRGSRKPRSAMIGAFIAGLLGIGGLGTSIANSVIIDRIGTQVTALTRAMVELQEKMDGHGDAIKSLFKLNDEIYAILHESVNQLSDMINDARCEAPEYSNIVHEHLVSHIFEETVRQSLDHILEASFTGTLSPMLISPKTLHKVMGEHVVLKNTILIRNQY